MENNFFEFKVKYNIEKIKENYKKANYDELASALKFDKWGQFYILKKLLSDNALEIEIVEEDKCASETKKTIQYLLFRHIILNTINHAPESELKSIFNTIVSMKDLKEPELVLDNHIATVLRTICETISNGKNKSDIYEIHEKPKEINNIGEAGQSSTVKLRKEEQETVVYTIDLISSINDENYQNMFIYWILTAINYSDGYSLFSINPIFQIKNSNIDKKELYDLNTLYEGVTPKTELLEYGIKYAKDNALIMNKLATYNNYQTLDDLVSFFKEDGLVADKNDLRILLSIKNNEHDILLEKKIRTQSALLLLMNEFLYVAMNQEHVHRFSWRYVYRIEDIYELGKHIYNSLQKTKNDLTSNLEHILEENKKKIEAVQKTVTYLDTWKVEESDINKLHSFQREYIMEKLKEEYIIKCGWYYTIRLNIDKVLRKFNIDSIFHDMHTVVSVIIFVFVISCVLAAIMYSKALSTLN